MREFVPRPFQSIMIAFALAVRRCALWAGMGMGKTSSVLAIIDILLLAGLVRKVVVFAPLRVARDGWPTEAKKWTQFADMRIAFIEWTPEERAFLRARNDFLKLKRRDDEVKNPATKDARNRAKALRESAAAARMRVLMKVDVLCVNYDLIQPLLAVLFGFWPFDMVVADESTRLKGMRSKQGGKRTQELAKVAFLPQVTRWINLTGTPAPNGLPDLWGQTWFIDQGKRLERTFSAFMDRWFGYKRVADAFKKDGHVKRVPFPHSQKEIQDLVRDICLTIDPKDWFDLNDPIVHTIYVQLPPDSRARYREMEKNLFTVIKDKPIEAVASAAKTNKLLQMANGFAYHNDRDAEADSGTYVEMHDEKLDALESIIEEASGMPVLVAYHYKPDLARLKHRFPDGLDLSKRVDMARAKEGEGRVWFGHPASMGHGVDGLQYHSNILVYYAHWWNLEERMQILERIGPMRQLQAGMSRPVFVYNIVAENTADEMVIERTVSKRSIQDILLDAMKRKENEDVAVAD